MTSEHVRGPEMRSGLKILGLGAACAAACSLPVILPALGFAFLGIGAGTWAILALIFVGMIGGLSVETGYGMKAAEGLESVSDMIGGPIAHDRLAGNKKPGGHDDLPAV